MTLFAFLVCGDHTLWSYTLFYNGEVSLVRLYNFVIAEKHVNATDGMQNTVRLTYPLLR